MLSIKISNTPIMPRSIETIKYLTECSKEEKNNHIKKCYQDTTKKLSEANDDKSKNIDLAYGEIVISGYLFAFGFSLKMIEVLFL